MSQPNTSSHGVRPRRLVRVGVAAAVAAGGVLAWAAPLPPVVAPPENPPTEAKRILGKMLFWDEQLSADDTMACGTCHLPDHGGADPRRGRNPGADGILGTADDVFGSPGVVHRDASGNFLPHPVFGLDRQVTGRVAPSALTGALADSLFWDGRAKSQFTDPQTSVVAIASGGGLESQCVGPPLSAAEMGREGRTWDDCATKLAAVRPLALAKDLPVDLAFALATNPGYPDLFKSAFGDTAITSQRIAFAIATYERTLVPNQTPWDRSQNGDPSALTDQEVRGAGAFAAGHCGICHTAPAFTDRAFHNIGVRPSVEDVGRQTVTGNAADRGKFKSPSLRNVGLRASFMHNGEITTLADVIGFYVRAGSFQQFTDNLDPAVNGISIAPPAAADLEAFLTNALTDPRAAAAKAPFDYPELYSEKTVHGPALAGAGRAGTAGAVPKMVAPMPPYLGNSEFRLGVGDGLAGAQAWLAVSGTAPVADELPTTTLLGPVILQGSGAGAGYATMPWPIPDDGARDGENVWFQWRVNDAAASGGVALSPVASATLFAKRTNSAVVRDDSLLFATSASFTIDWRRHAAGGAQADKLSLSGSLNPLGAHGPAGATFAVDLAGRQLLLATLDGAGRARSAHGASPSFTVRVDLSTGVYTASVAGVDLAAATGLTSHAGSGTIPLDVTVRVANAGLAADTVDATLPFAWSTREGRSTTGGYLLAKDALASGAFRPQPAKVSVRKDGTRSLRIDGSVAPFGGGAFVPTDELDVVVGDYAVALPATSLAVRGKPASATYQYFVKRAADGASLRFTYSAKTRSFSLAFDGVPHDALGSGVADGAPLAVRIGTVSGSSLTAFTATVAVRL